MSNTDLKSRCSSKVEQLVDATYECDWIPVSGEKTGEGVKGYTFQVCCQGDCQFVVKVQEHVKGSLNEWKQKIKEEVDMQIFAANLGVAPEVLDAFVCDHESYIVMDKMDITFKDYIKQLVAEQIFDDATIFSIIDVVQDEVINQLVATLHANNMIHNDLHLENVMLMLNEEYLPTTIRLIDFGTSKYKGSRAAADADETNDDIRMSFDMYRRYVRDPTSVNLDRQVPNTAFMTKKKQPRRMSFDEEDADLFTPSAQIKFGGYSSEEEEPEDFFIRRQVPPTPAKKSNRRLFDDDDF